MAYELFISEEAREQLRALPSENRRNIGGRLQQLQQKQLAGDIKKLEGKRNHYRLRVGAYRVLFRLIDNRIEVYAVKQRKEAYE